MLWLPEPSEEEKYGTEHPGFETLGHFEPRDAKRIIKRLDEMAVVKLDETWQIGPF